VPLLFAGIDEAGYGPTLGPLCVGMSLFRVRDWDTGQPAPDLWKLLDRAICKKPADARKRIPIADSKALKLANDSKTRHPLIHLERGVLAFLRSLAPCPDLPASDACLFGSLKAELETHPWYGTDPISLPVGSTVGELAIAASRLAAACEAAGVELLDLRCHIVNESVFNRTVKETGSKAEATAVALGHHLREIRSHHAAEPLDLRIVCDQLGGRTQYEGLLARELPGSRIAPIAESEARSRYSIGQNAIIQFMPEAESAHLPVALASMVAKLTRELAMMRFNRYWCGKVPELKPTAGYSTDARRWLTDMREVLHPEERSALVRIA
jgi:hypothetical protein